MFETRTGTRTVTTAFVSRGTGHWELAKPPEPVRQLKLCRGSRRIYLADLTVNFVSEGTCLIPAQHSEAKEVAQSNCNAYAIKAAGRCVFPWQLCGEFAANFLADFAEDFAMDFWRIIQWIILRNFLRILLGRPGNCS